MLTSTDRKRLKRALASADKRQARKAAKGAVSLLGAATVNHEIDVSGMDSPEVAQARASMDLSGLKPGTAQALLDGLAFLTAKPGSPESVFYSGRLQATLARAAFGLKSKQDDE